MGEYAEYALQGHIKHGSHGGYFAPLEEHPKIACPVCNKLCGGKGIRVRDGAHMHMKTVHGNMNMMGRKWFRDQLLDQAERPQ